MSIIFTPSSTTTALNCGSCGEPLGCATDLIPSHVPGCPADAGPILRNRADPPRTGRPLTVDELVRIYEAARPVILPTTVDEINNAPRHLALVRLQDAAAAADAELAAARRRGEAPRPVAKARPQRRARKVTVTRSDAYGRVTYPVLPACRRCGGPRVDGRLQHLKSCLHYVRMHYATGTS